MSTTSYDHIRKLKICGQLIIVKFAIHVTSLVFYQAEMEYPELNFDVIVLSRLRLPLCEGFCTSILLLAASSVVFLIESVFL